MEEKKLTVIILTYNTQSVIAKCLDCLDFERYNVVVVDNNSKDNTVGLIANNFKKVQVIQLPQNVGFSRANNVAMRKVTTPFALILNPDAFITNDDIEKILSKMEANPKVALAGPIVYSCDIENGKIIGEKLEKKYLGNTIKKDGDVLEVSFVLGAAMFVNMAHYKDICNGDDFFDENFFLYCDDNELAKRVMKKGYKNIMVEGTKILHMSEKSSGVSNEASAFRRYWHRYGWSKCHYARVTHGIFFGKLKALAIVLKSLILMGKDILSGKKITVLSKAMFFGAGSYLIGLSAFNKDGTSRA